MPVALITGASRGFGRATARALADRGWSLVVDARREADLADAVRGLPDVTAIAGDVTSAGHRAALAAAVNGLGGLDLLINNASSLGPSPLPPLRGLRPRRAAARLRDQRRRAAGADPAGRRPARRGRRRHRQRQLGRGGRGLPRLGRLRLVQGRARPAHRRPGRRGERPALLRVRPGRHADGDAPGRPSLARTSPTGPSPRASFPRCCA